MKVLPARPTQSIKSSMRPADVERYRLALDAVSSDLNVGIILVIVLLQKSYSESDVVDAINESQVTCGARDNQLDTRTPKQERRPNPQEINRAIATLKRSNSYKHRLARAKSQGTCQDGCSSRKTFGTVGKRRVSVEKSNGRRPHVRFRCEESHLLCTRVYP